MKKVLNFRVVEGVPNKVDKNMILLIRDKLTGRIKSIKKRCGRGSLEELIPDDYIYCKVKSWTDDLTNGGNMSLLKLGDTIGSLISSSLVNFYIFKRYYAPFDIINCNDGEGTSRYSNVKAIRIQKTYISTSLSDDADPIKFNTLNELQDILKLLGLDLDLSKALEEITKEEFDNMEIPTIPLM